MFVTFQFTGGGGGVNEKILEIMNAKYGQAITAFYIFIELGRGKLKLCINFGFVYNLGTTPSDFFPYLSVFVFLSCLVRFVISSAALFMQRTLLMPK